MRSLTSESDGGGGAFTVVTARRRQRQGGQRRAGSSAQAAAAAVEEQKAAAVRESISRALSDVDVARARASIASKCDALQRLDLVTTWASAWAAPDQPMHIVLYGVGRLGESADAQWQTACALRLRRLVDGVRAPCEPARLLLFEPLLCAAEVQLARELGCTPIENDEGRRSVTCPTLFYMPHCPAALYANVIAANVGALARVAVLGNPLGRMLKYVGRLALHRAIKAHVAVRVAWPLAGLDRATHSAFTDTLLTTWSRDCDDDLVRSALLAALDGDDGPDAAAVASADCGAQARPQAREIVAQSLLARMPSTDAVHAASE